MPALRTPRRVITAVIVSSAAVATMALGTGTAHAGTTAAGVPAAVSWSPTTSSNSFDYGSVPVGTAPAQTFTLRNRGLLPAGPLSVSLTGSSAFAITANSCTHAILGLNRTCSVTIRYTPDTASEDVATLSSRGWFGPRASLTLHGTPVGNPTFTSSSTFDFESVYTDFCVVTVNITNLPPGTYYAAVIYTDGYVSRQPYPFTSASLQDVWTFANPGVISGSTFTVQVYNAANQPFGAPSQTFTPSC